MSDYIKNIIRSKTDLTEIEWNVLIHAGNLPVLNKANTPLPPLQEVIVKVLYLAGGMFQQDIKKLLCYHSDIQKTERALNALKKDGYIFSQNTHLGLLIGLTGEGITQIRYHKDYYLEDTHPQVSDMSLDIESSLMKRKLVSSLIADHVFTVQTTKLLQKFYSTEIPDRNLYLLREYLKNVTYRKSLAGASYSQKDAEALANNLIETIGIKPLKNNDEYHRYIAYVKSHCIKAPNENTFYLLKGFAEKTTEYHVLKILLTWNCNAVKFGMQHIWDVLAEEEQTNELLHNEHELETCNQYLKYLGDEKRSLIQTNAYKKKEDEALLEQITRKLKHLDASLEKLRKAKDDLETDFSFPIVSGYDEDGNTFEERVLTFKRLEQNGIYTELTTPKKITFYVIQVQDDYFDLFSLHRKISMLYQLFRRIFPMYEINIQILTLTDEQKRFVESKVTSLQKKLLASRETAFLGGLLDEVLHIETIKPKIVERYHFFHDLLEILEGDLEDEF